MQRHSPSSQCFCLYVQEVPLKCSSTPCHVMWFVLASRLSLTRQQLHGVNKHMAKLSQTMCALRSCTAVQTCIRSCAHELHDTI